MGSLKVGQFVKVNDGSFDKVVGFLHREERKELSLLEITTSDGRDGAASIKLSHEHLLLTGDGFMQARNVKIGMQLVTEADELKNVTAIREYTDFGFAAPLTESGKIVVNGFKASCYARVPPSLMWAADLLMFPRRRLFVYDTPKGIDPYAMALQYLIPVALLQTKSQSFPNLWR